MHAQTWFANPIFVTPHAVDQFQQKIMAVPADVVIREVQASLKAADLVDLPVYRGYLGKEVFYAVVAPPKGKDWGAVVTILGKESHIHNKLMKERRLR